MPNTKPIKLERNLSLRPLAADKWEMRIQKPDRRKILYGTLAEATAEATALYKSALSGLTENPTVSEALTIALAAGTANDETLDRYIRESNRFQEWLKKAYPNVLMWRDVRRSVVQAYADALSSSDRARDSVRLAIFPIRKTSLFWHVEHPDDFHHVAQKIKLPEKSNTGPKAVTFDQMEAILAWLKANRLALYPIAALAAYTGMRLREPIGILNRDIDLKAGTISLKSNDIRDLKNEKYAPRTIPITAAAKEAIEHYLQHCPVRTIQPDEPLFLNQYGNPWHKEYFGAYCRQVMKSLRLKLEVPPWFVFRKFRASFNTLIIKAGAREAYTDYYQGREPKTVGRLNYLEVDSTDLEREVVSIFNELSGRVAISCTTKATMQP